jgi:sporulation protein YlmC with PRC-barrel domain
MDRNVKTLIGYSLKASNGKIGEVEEFYFDDESWKIRYLIVKTGSWLNGRKVLIAPHAIESIDWLNQVFHINLTKKQIISSPNIDTDKPVYRQHEINLHQYYGWEGYWLSGYYPTGYLGVSVPFPLIGHKELLPTGHVQKEANNDLHLRSTGKITGYHVHAKDGEIGHIYDCVVDDHTWQISHLVVDTHNWLGGKKVAIAIDHVLKVEWDNSKVYVDLTVSTVKKSKVFEETIFNPWEADNEVKVALPVVPIEIH